MAEVPVILGVKMALVGTYRWTVSFGCVDAMISPGSPDGFYWAVAGSLAKQETLADCIAAIERELLAIRAAIPPACYHCGDVLVSERDRCERCPSECDGDREEEHCAARAEVMGAAIPEAKP